MMLQVYVIGGGEVVEAVMVDGRWTWRRWDRGGRDVGHREHCMHVCVCVCVCEREREGRKTQIGFLDILRAIWSSYVKEHKMRYLLQKKNK